MAVKTAYQVGRTESEVLAYTDFVIAEEFSNSDFVSNVARVPIPPKSAVIGVRMLITEAFNGTSPTLIAGDAADDDGYLASGNVAAATLHSFANSTGFGTNAYAAGKYYPDGGAVLITRGGTGVTQGKVKVYVVLQGDSAP